MHQEAYKDKISLLITAWKEAVTVAKALEIYATGQVVPDQVIVVCPDEETKHAATVYQGRFPSLEIYTDPGDGKVAALQLGHSQARHELLICTDGDVIPDTSTVQKLVHTMQTTPTLVASTGRPYSLESRASLFGYWSHFLVDAAHHVRTRRTTHQQPISLSGYLFIIRTKAFPDIPTYILSDDAYISELLHSKQQLIGYTPEARVYVHYPTHYKDWILQKRRSAGGLVQLRQLFPPTNEMRSFRKEIGYGLGILLNYPKSPKEVWWTILLVVARLHLWLRITMDRHQGKHTSADLWQRVESTKE